MKQSRYKQSPGYTHDYLRCQAIPRTVTGSILNPDASYLLVGGLGGLGRATALWMTNHGARNLIFASRSGLAKQEARELVKELKERGVTVAVFSCDISDPSQLAYSLAQANSMPPIRGVIQGAMVLQVCLWHSHLDSNSTCNY